MELSDFALQNNDTKWIASLEDSILEHDDWSFLVFLFKYATSTGCVAAQGPLSKLLHRRLYRAVVTKFRRDFNPETHADKLHKQYCGGGAAKLRLQTARNLESDFHLPPGSVALYCPAAAMNAKIPEVKIHLDGSINTYSKWNIDYPEVLDGGHGVAQLKRFKRLWRVHLLVDSDVTNGWSNDVAELFSRVVTECVLDQRGNDATPREKVVERIARELTQISDSPYKGQLVTLAERSYNLKESGYAFDAPTIRSFFKSREA
jgi:hypothetical protein